ncbi:uncharacterized protein LOC134529267 [Bacillus rossius redtenbacheri]|uniref:uncharacterized protein LOC134529267 n=1 Tax=Bacillus rossius redtenbacheri TaxID=93214 RepID=UPI002FDD6115
MFVLYVHPADVDPGPHGKRASDGLQAGPERARCARYSGVAGNWTPCITWHKGRATSVVARTVLTDLALVDEEGRALKTKQVHQELFCDVSGRRRRVAVGSLRAAAKTRDLAVRHRRAAPAMRLARSPPTFPDQLRVPLQLTTHRLRANTAISFFRERQSQLLPGGQWENWPMGGELSASPRQRPPGAVFARGVDAIRSRRGSTQHPAAGLSSPALFTAAISTGWTGVPRYTVGGPA